jgi:cytochrome P450
VLNLVMDVQRRNPYPAYWLMRRMKPIVYLPKYDLWFVSSYEDVKRVLSDYSNFSSDFRRLMQPNPPPQTMRANLIAADPPIHTKLRALISRGFTRRTVANLEPRIEELANELLDEVLARGAMDLVRDLAYPLPVAVIAEMLGVPTEDRTRFKEWSDLVVRAADRVFEERESSEAFEDEANAGMPPEAMEMMGPYFRMIIEERRAEPRNDLISALIASEIDGERLTERDILSFASLLLVAGNVTTTNLITNAVQTLLHHPKQLARLREDMSLLPSAIEEVLRYRSPVQFMFRVAAKEGDLNGQRIKPGGRVIALIGSANRDAAKFPNPNTFDITRSPNPHIAFGHGIHHCLGAPLARLEAKVALSLLLDRTREIERVGWGPLPPSDGIILHGVKRLPLRFEAKPRVLVP